MAGTITGLIKRLIKGSPLTPAEGDNNLTILETFSNGLSQIIGVSLNPDGTLAAGALNSVSQIANLPTLADAFAAGETLPVGTLATGTYSVTNPTITAYVAGMRTKFIASAANAGATGVKFNALPVVPIVKGVSLPLVDNDILASQVVTLEYDGTNFQLVHMAVAFASAAEILAGTDATKPITSAALKSASLQFVSPLTPMTFVAGPVYNAVHGLLGTPTKVRFVLVCTGAENGFVIGDEVNYQDFWYSVGGNYPCFVAGANATSVFITYNGLALAILNKVTGTTAGSFVDNANWSVKCYASL